MSGEAEFTVRAKSFDKVIVRIGWILESIWIATRRRYVNICREFSIETIVRSFVIEHGAKATFSRALR